MEVVVMKRGSFTVHEFKEVSSIAWTTTTVTITGKLNGTGVALDTSYSNADYIVKIISN